MGTQIEHVSQFAELVALLFEYLFLKVAVQLSCERLRKPNGDVSFNKQYDKQSSKQQNNVYYVYYCNILITG